MPLGGSWEFRLGVGEIRPPTRQILLDDPLDAARTSFPGLDPLPVVCHVPCRVEEVATPYYIWREKGFSVDIVSVKGGAVPWDPNSTAGDFCTPQAALFLKNDAALVADTKGVGALSDADLDAYDAVFVAGGHGIVFDGDDAGLQRVLGGMWARGKIVSAVCHGPGALCATRDAAGAPLFKGRRATGFTDAEEVAVGKMDAVPFALEARMRELGADFAAAADWTPHVVADGKLITGQNPMSSAAVAEAVADAVLPGIEPQHGGDGGAHRDHPVAKDHHHANEDPKAPHHPQANVHEGHGAVHQTTQTGFGGR